LNVFERLPNHEQEIAGGPHFSLAFADPHPRPLTLVEHVVCHATVFCRALAPHFLFLAGGAEERGGATTWAGTSHSAIDRHASAFEGKPNNSHKQVQ
jgi:hypothetical protein